jgi:hypothetical protein
MTLMLECRMQTVKAVKTIQAETSEDFSADEWQTAKAGLRRSANLLDLDCTSAFAACLTEYPVQLKGPWGVHHPHCTAQQQSYSLLPNSCHGQRSKSICITKELSLSRHSLTTHPCSCC